MTELSLVMIVTAFYMQWILRKKACDGLTLKQNIHYQPSREYDVIWTSDKVEVAITVSNGSITCKKR